MGSIKLRYSFLSILLPVFCFFFFKFILAALSTWQASHIPEQGANRMNIFKTRKGAFMILKKTATLVQDVTTCKRLKWGTKKKKNTDQGNVRMSRDWAEAPRLLKVSCLIYTHALWGLSSLRGEKTSFVCTLMKQPYTPELMLILTSLATAIWLSNRSLCHTLWRLKHLLFFSLLPCGSLEGGRRNPEEGGSRWCDAYVLNDEEC